MSLPAPKKASTAKAQPGGGSGALQPNLVTDCYKERHGSKARAPAEISARGGPERRFEPSNRLLLSRSERGAHGPPLPRDAETPDYAREM